MKMLMWLNLLVVTFVCSVAWGAKSYPPLNVTINNNVKMDAGCSGATVNTFVGGSRPIGSSVTLQVPYNAYAPGGGGYVIGFQVNGNYWRQLASNPKGCVNPDNAGQVGIFIKPNDARTGCVAATVAYMYGACDKLVPNALPWVSVQLTKTTPCTVTLSSKIPRAPTVATAGKPTTNCCGRTGSGKCKTTPPGQSIYPP